MPAAAQAARAGEWVLSRADVDVGDPFAGLGPRRAAIRWTSGLDGYAIDTCDNRRAARRCTAGMLVATGRTVSRTARLTGLRIVNKLTSLSVNPITPDATGIRSWPYVSSSRSAARPPATRASFQARFAASIIPVFMP